MKTLFSKQFPVLLAIAVIGGFAITSCDDEGDDIPVNKTVLMDSIAVAVDLLATTEQGINDGQYSAESRTALQDATTAAQAVVDNLTVTQEQVDNAVVALHNALETYRAAKIAPVAEADLIAHWAFDEGSGTTAGDNSANGFDGTFKTGAEEWGAGVPAWAADRNGDAGKALYFNEGANIEIPYNTNLNPEQISIALWINADEINANNRFLGLHSWIAYKFQLQEANRPFMTVHSEDDQYFDRDAEVNLPIDEWHHIAVTFGGGNMIFYIDGEMVKTWENTPGVAKDISASPYNLVIGQDFPTDQYAPTPDNFATDQKIPLEWGGYFRGHLDELRLYKTVLTDSQIASIYNREKPE